MTLGNLRTKVGEEGKLASRHQIRCFVGLDLLFVSCPVHFIVVLLITLEWYYFLLCFIIVFDIGMEFYLSFYLVFASETI